MAKIMELLVVMTVFLSAVTNVQRSDAATYTVGDSSSWSTPFNGDSSTYTTWANQHQFVTGDVLVFNFNTGLHTVATVNNKNDYDSCNAANANVQNNGPTIHGDIYDCVDIYKQPGMDHPTMATERIQFAGVLVGNAPSERFTGFVMTSNVVPLDYAFPNISVLRGEQFDVTLQVVKRSTGDWELNYNDQQLGECYEPENQGVSPQMGSGGRFREGKYDRTAYMRQLGYIDPTYGDAVLDDSMVQVQISRCYFATNEGYNFKDDWYGYSFMYGGKGGQDGAECFDSL
nr:blue copper protein-like [Ipomoea batatas]